MGVLFNVIIEYKKTSIFFLVLVALANIHLFLKIEHQSADSKTSVTFNINQNN